MNTDILLEKKPSLLRQIVDEVDTLDEEAMEDVLKKIKIKKAIEATRVLGEKLKDSWTKMSEEEIAESVSKDRKEYYESNSLKFSLKK